MLRLRLLRLAFAPAMLLGAGDVHCQERAPEPYELMRTLRAIQDRIARGDNAAFLSYKTSLTRITQQFGKAPAAAWKDPRNVRAAVALVLSGGDPRILEPLVAQVTGPDQKLVSAALAYGHNSNDEAKELLADIDARTLDASVAGHVALIQAELAGKAESTKILARLGEARLLAPGTMIEETALRREVSSRCRAQRCRSLRELDQAVHAPVRQFRAHGEFPPPARHRRGDPRPGRRAGAQVEARSHAGGCSPTPSGRTSICPSPGRVSREAASISSFGRPPRPRRWPARTAPATCAPSCARRPCSSSPTSSTRGSPCWRAFRPRTSATRRRRFSSRRCALPGRSGATSKPPATDTGPPRGATEPLIVASARSAIARVDDLLGGGRK